MDDLHTERLVLVALTPGLAQAALGDRKVFGSRLGARVPKAWPGADFARMLPMLAGGREWATGGAPVVPTRLILHRSDRVLVGEAGFHGPPDASGVVEVGYSVVPDHRGCGIASEATRALLRDAFERVGVRRVVAEAMQENAASVRVLEKLGMTLVGRPADRVRFALERGPASLFAPD